MTLFTIGHGTSERVAFTAWLDGAGIRALADVRRFPGSRRWPWFNADEMARWVPAAGIVYRPEPELGGRRRPRPDSVNVALREPGFRAYADYMATEPFRAALDALLARAADAPTAVMCSETVWWRCHRRLIADAATLLHDVDVVHLVAGMPQSHRPTRGVRVADGVLVYDVVDELPVSP
ncbi:MAG TPA: DUF488 domain-containing protein [Candidatus Elarobacter sp.]|jgi:uncharacterized protein (DUF488 family)|nr:DUF488 domain-containing protein [Candidatus Elarobacter sp.]